jgi:acyl carrier protein
VGSEGGPRGVSGPSGSGALRWLSGRPSIGPDERRRSGGPCPDRSSAGPAASVPQERLHERVQRPALQLKRLAIERLELDHDPDSLPDDADLRDEIGLDSAALLDLIAGIEEEFGIDVDTEEITEERFKSIDSLARFVASKT